MVRQRFPQPGDQPFGLRPGAGPAADGEDRREHVVQAARIEGDDLGGAAKIAKRVFDVAGWQRADPAQVLGENQRGKRRQGPLMQRVKVPPAARRPRT